MLTKEIETRERKAVIPKPIRIVDKALLARVRELPCVACGARRTEAAHIKSRGAGGGDTVDNVIPLCRRCHSSQHQLGWFLFLDLYPTAVDALKIRGWTIVDGKLGKMT